MNDFQATLRSYRTYQGQFAVWYARYEASGRQSDLDHAMNAAHLANQCVEAYPALANF